MSLVAPRDTYMSSLIWVVHILISAQIHADPLSLRQKWAVSAGWGDTGALSFILRKEKSNMQMNTFITLSVCTVVIHICVVVISCDCEVLENWKRT